MMQKRPDSELHLSLARLKRESSKKSTKRQSKDLTPTAGTECLEGWRSDNVWDLADVDSFRETDRDMFLDFDAATSIYPELVRFHHKSKHPNSSSMIRVHSPNTTETLSSTTTIGKASAAPVVAQPPTGSLATVLPSQRKQQPQLQQVKEAGAVNLVQGMMCDVLCNTSPHSQSMGHNKSSDPRSNHHHNERKAKIMIRSSSADAIVKKTKTTAAPTTCSPLQQHFDQKKLHNNTGATQFGLVISKRSETMPTTTRNNRPKTDATANATKKSQKRIDRPRPWRISDPYRTLSSPESNKGIPEMKDNKINTDNKMKGGSTTTQVTKAVGFGEMSAGPTAADDHVNIGIIHTAYIDGLGRKEDVVSDGGKAVDAGRDSQPEKQAVESIGNELFSDDGEMALGFKNTKNGYHSLIAGGAGETGAVAEEEQATKKGVVSIQRFDYYEGDNGGVMMAQGIASPDSIEKTEQAAQSHVSRPGQEENVHDFGYRLDGYVRGKKSKWPSKIPVAVKNNPKVGSSVPETTSKSISTQSRSRSAPLVLEGREKKIQFAPGVTSTSKAWNEGKKDTSKPKAPVNKPTGVYHKYNVASLVKNKRNLADKPTKVLTFSGGEPPNISRLDSRDSTEQKQDGSEFNTYSSIHLGSSHSRGIEPNTKDIADLQYWIQCYLAEKGFQNSGEPADDSISPPTTPDCKVTSNRNVVPRHRNIKYPPSTVTANKEDPSDSRRGGNGSRRLEEFRNKIDSSLLHARSRPSPQNNKYFDDDDDERQMIGGDPSYRKNGNPIRKEKLYPTYKSTGVGVRNGDDFQSRSESSKGNRRHAYTKWGNANYAHNADKAAREDKKVLTRSTHIQGYYNASPRVKTNRPKNRKAGSERIPTVTLYREEDDSGQGRKEVTGSKCTISNACTHQTHRNRIINSSKCRFRDGAISDIEDGGSIISDYDDDRGGRGEEGRSGGGSGGGGGGGGTRIGEHKQMVTGMGSDDSDDGADIEDPKPDSNHDNEQRSKYSDDDNDDDDEEDNIIVDDDDESHYHHHHIDNSTLIRVPSHTDHRQYHQHHHQNDNAAAYPCDMKTLEEFDNVLTKLYSETRITALKAKKAKEILDETLSRNANSLVCSHSNSKDGAGFLIKQRNYKDGNIGCWEGTIGDFLLLFGFMMVQISIHLFIVKFGWKAK